MADPARPDRLVLVSNRLPVAVHATGGAVEVVPSSGGLVTGLRGPHEQGDGLWIGWPGDLSALAPEARADVDRRLADLRAVPVELAPDVARGFYEGISNGVLWPLFHYLIDRVPLLAPDWDHYVRANEAFADVVAANAGPDDCIWIHDYHLMLLPAMLRRRMPSARIGFFLHIPFPSSDVFRILPWREAILEGLLGADVIGFHTFAYMRHFALSLLHILGIEASVDRLHHEGRAIRLGVFPMGIDAAAFAAMGQAPAVVEVASKIRENQGGAKLLLGVDRLDYTKGLRRRLLAMERLLETHPELRGNVRLFQIAVPTREDVDEYRDHRADLEQLVGRINGAYSTIHGAPIHYVHRSISREDLVALYRAADVMVVTPLRDGMNLVAKEFVASRVDGDGVLVLSELAGAASELGEALLVNPYDVDGIARALARALEMPEAERRRRMATLRARVTSRSAQDWAASFVSALASARDGAIRTTSLAGRPERIAALAAGIAASESLTLLLDYDGTLVSLARTADQAAPDPPLLELLAALAASPGVAVHMVTGRTRESIEAWLGRLPIALHAEHGLWSRFAPGTEWTRNASPPDRWMERVRPILEEYVARTPGSFIEEKSATLAWHYRASDPYVGALQSKELRLHLVESLAQQPVDVLAGEKVLEIRPQGVNKGLIARALEESFDARHRIVAFGDDRTDEDLFAALPSGSISFHVGAIPSRADYRLAGPREVRSMLEQIVRMRAGGGDKAARPAAKSST